MYVPNSSVFEYSLTHFSNISIRPSTTDDIILGALPAADLLRYSQTCKSVYTVAKAYMMRTFRVDSLLSRYFQPQEVVRFRELQSLTGTIISGSTALQFFDRTVYPESDLDLYTEHRHCRPLAQWLLEIDYKYTPSSNSPNIDSLDKAFALNLPKKEPNMFLILSGLTNEDYNESAFTFNFEKRNPYRKVQLITSCTTPIAQVLQFHSSASFTSFKY